MRIGFIGAGNMGSSIIAAALRGGLIEPNDLYISRKQPKLSWQLAEKGAHILNDNAVLAQSVDCIVLAVKPIYTSQVLGEVYDKIKDKLLISIVAGWSFEMLKAALPNSTRFVRVMPNMPLAIGEGMSLISASYTCTQEELAFVCSLFASAGQVEIVEDAFYTAANGISGCGPAFVYQFIEALADGGVRYGVPRALAYKLAAQTLIGAGKMLLETGEHPGKLKDAVCSPGGTTIEGVLELERGGMRAAVIEAVSATVEKVAKLPKH